VTMRGRGSPSRPLQLLWTADWWGKDWSNGYTVHSRMMRKALAELGVELITDPAASFDLAVHFAPIVPEFYSPIPGARNLLFTMVELTEPTMWHTEKSPALLEETAALIVPCRHSKDVLARYYSREIHICLEGVSERFAFHERRPPGLDEPFRYLFVGQTYDPRKGHLVLLSAWQAWAATGLLPPNAELYIKTTKPLQNDLLFPWPWFDGWNGHPEILEVSVPQLPRVTLDARNLPLAELISLYNSAAVFIAPSQGEGWNLCLSDAAATGCPCIYTAWGGHLEYMDEAIGIPITEFSMIPIWGKDDAGNWRKHGEGEPSYYGAGVDETTLILRMMAAYRHYPEALERGKRASERMHSCYTWEKAATRFIEICERYA
jgi:glycosyltransferase involved in cell wall biosynthesis